MHKKLVLIQLIMLLCGYEITAQISPIIQLPQYNLGVLNPAYRPSDNNFDLSLSSQSHGLLQETPINDRRLFSGSIYKRIPSNNIGVGLVVNQTRNASIRNTSFGISGNYAIGSEKFTLSFGLNAGLIQLRDEDPFGDLRQENDVVLTDLVNTATGLQLNTGLFFFTEKTKLSLSINQLGTSGEKIRNSNVVINRNYILFAQHDIKISDSFVLQPSLLTQFVPSNNLILRPTLSTIIKELFTIGIQYESIGFLGFTGEINLYRLIPSFSENIQLFFLSSHAINNQVLAEFGSKTEIGVSYKFNFRPDYKKVLNEKIIDSPVEYHD